jgi:hypothetical protein
LVTDNSLRVTEAKVRTPSNQVISLVPTTSQQSTGAFSLANVPAGVYTLDVITQKPGAKAAYGGVLSIGNQPATVIEETKKRVTNDYGDLILVSLPPEEEECPPGTTGIPPDCEPISCDVEDPPDECGEETIECPDGRTVPISEGCGEDVPDDPRIPVLPVDPPRGEDVDLPDGPIEDNTPIPEIGDDEVSEGVEGDDGEFVEEDEEENGDEETEEPVENESSEGDSDGDEGGNN